MADIKHGVDLSKHNGTVNWQQLKASGRVDFVIIRAGYGKLASQKDIKFEANYAGAKSVGIPVGCYWYSYAKSVAEAKQEAEVFLSIIKGKQFEYPVYLDLEEQSQFNLGKATCSAMAKAFLSVLEKAGYYAGIYSSKSGLTSYLDDEVRTKYTVWVAQINIAKTNYAYPYDIWQYSFKGNITGISGDVDMNYCYKDFPTIIKKIGLNGYPKQQQEPQEETPAPTTNTDPVEPPSDSSNIEKKKVKVTVEFDDHTYSGLLEEQ